MFFLEAKEMACAELMNAFTLYKRTNCANHVEKNRCFHRANVTRLERAAVAYADESAAKLKTQNAFFLSDPSYRMRMEIHGNAWKI